MDEQTNLFNKVAFMLDQNIRAVQIGVYSVAFTGFAIALHSVRPFSKFRKPSDVPKHFLTSRTQLRGRVERIEPNGALLMVQHKPLIRFLRPKGECLPVQIAGVNITGNGMSWLQTVVAGHDVTFVPVMKKPEYLSCEVTLLAKRDKKISTLNLGPALVQVGFGTISPIEKSLISDASHLGYYRQLIAAEQILLRKQLGLWYYAKPTKKLSLALFNIIILLFQKMLSSKNSKVVKKVVT